MDELSKMSLNDLMEQSSVIPVLHPGDVVKGRVIKVGEDYALLDINYKSEGYLPLKEERLVSEKYRIPSIEVGEELEVMVDRINRNDDTIYLSLEKLRAERLWDRLKKAHERKEILEGDVIDVEERGLIVDLGLRAYMPISQIDLSFIKKEDLDKYLGKTLRVIITDINPEKGILRVSARKVLKAERDRLKKETLERLKEGIKIEGEVKRIIDSGAFVDIGGIDAFLPISEITWSRIKNPLKLLKVGDTIEARVIKFDRENERVTISIKALTEDPWKDIDKKYSPGDKVVGKVTKLMDYGAFVELEEGVEGLLHVSDLSWARVRHPKDVVKVGDPVELAVVSVDPENKRISLSLKQLLPDPWDNIEEEFPIGKKVKGEIVRFYDFGAIINLDMKEGIRGLLRPEEVSWDYNKEKPFAGLKKWMILEFLVMDYDRENRYVLLSRKRLFPNPWEGIEERYKVGSLIEGKVVRIANFGAFIRIEDNLEGLLPAREITWDKVPEPMKLIKKNETLTLKVINIDKENKRITLSLRQTRPSPWDELKEKYPVGSVVEGTVTNIVDFGAFVEIEKGIEGLVRLSELSPAKRIDDPNEVVSVGEKVNVMILNYDDKKRKISLSIAKAQEKLEEEEMRKYMQEDAKPITLGDIIGDQLEKLKEARSGE